MLLLTHLLALAAPAELPGDALPVRHWNVQHVDLNLRFDPGAPGPFTIEGTATHTVTPLGLPHDVVRLHQVGLRIAEVRVDAAVISDWTLGDHTLDIPVTPGAPHTIAIDYTATPQTGAHQRRPLRGSGPSSSAPYNTVEVWTQGENEDNRHWFPGWDHPSDRFTVSQTLTVPSRYHVVANGDLRSQDPAEPGWTRWRYELDASIVNYLVAFAAGTYDVHLQEGAPPIEVIVPRGTPSAQVKAGYDAVPDMLDFFAELTGAPYPYGVYRQVAVQRFLYGGMENASTTILAADRMVGPDDIHLASLEGLLAHELAHQWFGDHLTCRGWRELWLNEGFATYYTALWTRHARGDEAFAAQVWRWNHPARSSRRPVAYRPWAADAGSDYADVYTRGASALHSLRVMLGATPYDDAIRSYVAAHGGQLVETDDLRRHLEAVSGQHLGWFFDRLIHGTGAPTLTSRWQFRKGELHLTVKQRGETTWPGPITVHVGTDDGVWVRVLPGPSEAGDDTRQLTLEMPAAPRWVSVDPEGGVLAHRKPTQPTAAWARQLAEAPTAFARQEAVLNLGEAKSDLPAAYTALSDALRGAHRIDPNAPRPDQAMAAARSLASLGGSSAAEALIAGLEGAAPELRAEIATALGRLTGETSATATLRRIAARDDVAAVRAAAINALSHLDADVAGPIALRALARPDPTQNAALHQAATDALGRRGEPADRRRLLDLLRHPHRDVQHSAGYALQRASQTHTLPAGESERIANALATWLDHDDQRTRATGLRLLGQLGTDSSLGPLHAYGKRTTIDRHRSQVESAVARIRVRRQQADLDADTLAALEAKIDKLTQRLDKLDRERKAEDAP